MKNNKINMIDWAALSLALFHTSPIAVNQFAPRLISEINFPISSTEIILSLNAITATIFLLLAGNIQNRLGLKKSTIYGLVLVVISGLVPILIRNQFGIVLNRVILGAGIGIYATASSTVIYLFNKGGKKARLLGYRNAAKMIGLMLAILLAGVLGRKDLFKGFLVYAFAIIPLILFIKNVPSPENYNQSEKNYSNINFKLNNHLYFYIIYGMSAIMLTSAMNFRFLTVLDYNGTSLNFISIFTIATMLIGMIGGLIYSFVFNRFKKNTLIFSSILFIVGCILMAFSENNFFLLSLSVAIGSFTQSVFISYIIGDIENRTDNEHVGKATGIVFTANNIGALLAPFALVLLKSFFRSNSLTNVFLGFAIIMSLLLIFDVLLIREKDYLIFRKS